MPLPAPASALFPRSCGGRAGAVDVERVIYDETWDLFAFAGYSHKLKACAVCVCVCCRVCVLPCVCVCVWGVWGVCL